jgi:hypothetical protein
VVLKITVDSLICSFGLDSAGPGPACNTKPMVAISIFSTFLLKIFSKLKKEIKNELSYYGGKGEERILL